MQKIIITLSFILFSYFALSQNISSVLYLKTAGNNSEQIQLEKIRKSENHWILNSGQTEKIKIELIKDKNTYKFVILALAEVNFNLQNEVSTDLNYENTNFLLPGFWYRKNLRSPEGAASAKVSKNWLVREDRLSTPLTAAFDTKSKNFVRIMRTDNILKESLGVPEYGEIILNSKTDLGSLGFGESQNKVNLRFGFPYMEAPHTYLRKLTLAPQSIAFITLKKGETIELNYEIIQAKAENYADFVKQTWIYSFDKLKPSVVENSLKTSEVKKILSNFFIESYVDESELKGFSGAHIRTDKCEKKQILEVGFIGRVLLNAFNALEYGYETNNKKPVEIGKSVFDSYLEKGFKTSGFFREYVDFEEPYEDDVISIRRQSEGIYAVLLYLDYEKQNGREHKEWERKIRKLLDKFLKLQQEAGSFPRKFNSNLKTLDSSGGSSPSAVLPLVMAYKYFGNENYLACAKKTANYLEDKIVKPSDYFSSTLDANCEDKEASFYTATAFYYLALVSKGKENRHYTDLAAKANYFVLSWYYTWDVPFAKGQMLGDVGFKTRGWGNVSVENNHVDVFIFGYLDVLNWLAKEKKEKRFSEFAKVIESSMKSQLLPRKGNMFNIAKVGYQPEVVQHTHWDYGHFGKGFYNDIFAPGWTVASLWEMLSPGRAEEFLK